MKTLAHALNLAAALGVVTVLAGCASRSVEHFYTVSGPRSAATSTESPRIAVAAIAIPALIDRPQLVVRTTGHELSLLEDHRWAEPLSQDLTRALVDALRRSPGGLDVVERDTPGARAVPLMLEVTIAELIAGPGPSASLHASWVLRDRQRSCVTTGRFDVDVPMQSGYEAIPAAYAVAISRLADRIAESIGQGVPCADLARSTR
jgi:uncharacterized protein